MKKSEHSQDVPNETSKNRLPKLASGLGIRQRLRSPTLRSVRRMSNLQAALREINRRPSRAGSFPYEAFTHPFEYMRLDPNLWTAYEGLPMGYLQEEFDCEYGYEPEQTVMTKAKGRLVESGTIPNRIIDRAMSRKLNASVDRYFSDSAHAYRPGRSTLAVVSKARDVIRRGNNWAMKTDIKHFFPSVNRRLLERQLRNSINDQRLCVMILRANSPVNGRGGWVELADRRRGLPEGNGLSPFLSNLYLTGVDKALEHLNYFRYADDILILAKSFAEVVTALEFLAKLLKRIGLGLNCEKTELVDLYEKPLVYLGYEIRGGNLYPSHKAIRRLKQKLRIRGLEARQKIDLMEGFVTRFEIGPVRKLLRRVDRELRQYYPGKETLTGILDHRAGFNGRVGSPYEVAASSMGKTAEFTAKKAPLGQAPVAVAGWGAGSL